MVISSIIRYPYSKKYSDGQRAYWSLFPPNLLTIGLQLPPQATEGPKAPGITWSNRAKCLPNQQDCVVTMGGNCSFCSGSLPRLEPITPDDEDVLKEETTVKQQATEVQIHGLVKTYPGKSTGRCRCKKRTPPFHSVKYDIIWDTLSCQEHLQLFANIKGLPPAEIDKVVEQLLSKSKITKVASKMRFCSYSGGMKRRLSVAAALIGDPKLAILDEPVADVLSDRIAIMAKGRLRCIGTSIRLKSKFGTGFIASVGFSSETSQPEAVKHFFKSRLDVVPKEENKSVLTYVIPHEKESLLTLGLTTIEEVFMNIAKQAELETAIAEGKFTTLTLSSGTSLEVPAGSRFVGIPGTKSPQNPGGIMVEVYWEPDESGGLCISDHSDEMPIPPHIQQSDPPNTKSAKNEEL
ncbi:hypothetical protein RND71_010349 [Anisodus tanguticus]|uniref:ABC transporter domain-containing protein n=1 Tax=Anisodus tanguticus TaxID=243964 RepID=A0AAE1SHL2_9SOLA|nr:hypothetical protein RND71_010349 [Anisodus tanguticus]